METWPDGLLDRLARHLQGGGVLVAAGRSAQGRTALVTDLAQILGDRGGNVWILGADPGQPSWGPPACLSLVRAPVPPGREATLAEIACAGALDPYRRTALYLAALGRLARRASEPASALLVEAPGTTRGHLAVDLLSAMLEVLDASALVVLQVGRETDALAAAFRDRSDVSVVDVPAIGLPRPATRASRRRLRSQAWSAYLGSGAELELLPTVRHRGRRPERDEWPGRLVGLLDADQRTVAMAEVVRVDDAGEAESVRLRVRIPEGAAGQAASIHTVLATEARRDPDGGIVSVARPSRGRSARSGERWTLPDRPQQRIRVTWPERAGQAPYEPRFLNSVSGDPALMLRHPRRGRALLFDIGWLEPLPAKILHGVTDVFLSHAHMDHAQGLVTLLRVLLGPGGHIRLYGPPGLDAKVAALLNAFDLNLLGDGGPTLDVHTLSAPEEVLVTHLRCGEPRDLPPREHLEAPSGRVLAEPGLAVWARELQHSVPVLAYRCESWRTAAGREGAPAPARYALAYVTDVADTPENRRAIVALARDADLFVCEAMFLERHAERARRTGHLTARACGQLGREANVQRLVPFHFSARYQDRLQDVYQEVMQGLGKRDALDAPGHSRGGRGSAEDE
jgi:ribonuclease BN (tRNA processing enzyme)